MEQAQRYWCPRCNGEIYTGDRFCSQCGWQFAAPATAASHKTRPLLDTPAPLPGRQARFNAAGLLFVSILILVSVCGLASRLSQVGKQGATSQSITADEQAYLDKLQIQVGRISGLLDLMEHETSAPDRLSANWRKRIALPMSQLRDVANELNALQAPPRLAELDGHAKSLARHFNASMTYFADGIDNLDPDAISHAGAMMEQGNDDMHEATTFLSKFLQEHR
jgi:hypothetical protein